MADVAKMLIEGGELRVPRLDKSSHAHQTISTAHQESHAGHKFVASARTTDLSANPLHFVFTTPDSDHRMHLVIRAYSAGAAVMRFVEGPSGGVSGGSAVTPINRRRDSALTSGTTGFTQGATAPTGGMTLDEIDSGVDALGPGGSGGSEEDRDEWILDRNTQYSVLFTSSEAVTGNLRLDWYEHADRN